MDGSRPLPVTGLRGHVVRAGYGKGSKSERPALFIETADGRYLLRRKAGPSFGDTELDSYVGLEVACDGFIVGTTLLADKIRVIA